MFRRAHDARKKSNIFLIYTLDLEVKNEAALLQRFAKDPNVKPTPDLDYKFVARAAGGAPFPPRRHRRGPCGLFAGVAAGADGVQAHHP